MWIKKGQILWSCSGDDPNALIYAKDYIQVFGLSNEDVKIIKSEDQMNVIAKKDFILKKHS